jgi:F-type H+-transporting ATPase subunit delta
MQGSSRAAAAAGQEVFEAALAGGSVDPASLADDLLGVAAAIDSSAALRRALTDPTRDAAAKGGLARNLLAGKASGAAIDVVATLVGQRWSVDRDLTDTIERFAVEALAASAAAQGRGDQVEDELFRFERIVAGTPALRDALTDRHADAAGKAALVDRLLADKVSPATARLARQAVSAPRGRRFSTVIEEYLGILAERRAQLAATVTSAVELDGSQRERLAAALTRIYGKQVHLNVVLDPSVVGGIKVEIGDEVVDGTVLRKLEGARRHFGS